MTSKAYIRNYWVGIILIMLFSFGIAQLYHPSFLKMDLEQFNIFQSTYVGIILFIVVFTLFHYFQNRNQSYLFYTLYLLMNLVYFVKIFPGLLGFLIPEDWTQNLFELKRQYGSEVELTLSLLLIASYTRFIQSFVDLKNRNPKINQWFNWGYVAMIIFLLIDYLIIVVVGNSVSWEIVVKLVLLIPGAYAIYMILKSRDVLIDMVLMGTSVFIIGAVINIGVAILYRNGFYLDDFGVNQNKHFLYMFGGSLLEVLFFTTAIGYQGLLNEKEKNEAQQKLFDQLNENNSLRIRQLEADVKTLKSQINPHFIFNSLNAIKLLIQENQNQQANQYLIQFSELLRIVMEQAKQAKITLEEELKTSKVYLQLEALRFDHTFDFEIIQDEQVDTSFIEVPPLIFQPFLENAIWHGLLHKQGDRKVKIEISQKVDTIICTIKDNGIGRKKSAALSQQFGWFKKSSIGIQNTQERISIFNQLYKTEIDLEIIDLKKDNNEALGTEVIFRFAM